MLHDILLCACVYIYLYVHTHNVHNYFHVCSSYEWITFEGTCVGMFVWLCTSLSYNCTVVNKQKQALALMKGCCLLLYRSATIWAPCGCRDRLFFCLTVNLRVQGINLTLLGETTEGPMIQHNNSARKETWVGSATDTFYNSISHAQHCCHVCEKKNIITNLFLFLFLSRVKEKITWSSDEIK